MLANFRLDIYTLFAVLTLINLAGLVFSIILFFSRQVFAGAGLWIAGQAAIVLASAGYILRDISPPIIGIVLPNTLYLVAGVALLSSIWQFRFYKSMPFWYWLAVPAFALMMYLTLPNTINVRIVLFSIVLGLTSCFTAGLLFVRIQKPMQLSSYLLGSTFILIGMIQFLRLPDALFGPTILSMQNQSQFTASIYLVSILSAFAMLFGYYLMSGVRFEENLRLNESAITKKNRELEELNKTKGLLLSVIAHDLQAPIVSASRYVDNFLLPAEVKLEEKRKALAILGLTLSKASRLLTDLLMWAENQQATGILALAQVPIAELVAQALEMIDSDYKTKLIGFSLQISQRSIAVDRQSAVTVLRNLMSNAVKFSPPGSQISVHDRETASATSIMVTDHGVGIPPENLAVLRRGDTMVTTTGTYGEYGNGIGLLLCRSLMQRHGGSLEIDSSPGQGTTFTVHFPKQSRD